MKVVFYHDLHKYYVAPEEKSDKKVQYSIWRNKTKMELKNQVIKSCLSKTKMLPFHSNIPAKSKPYSKYFSTSICTAKHFSGQTFHETVPLCSGRIPRPHGLLYFLVFCPSSYRVVSPADPGILDHSPRGNVGKQGLSLLECLYHGGIYGAAQRGEID